MSICLICLGGLDRGPTVGAYHRRCLQDLFGRSTVPEIDVELVTLDTAGLAMAGRVSVPGVQRKILLGLTSDGSALRVALGPSRYILKPQTTTYPSLP